MANSRCTCSPRAPRTACAATDSARTPSRRSTRRPRWRSLTTLRARRSVLPLLPHVLGAPLVDESPSEDALVADAAALRDRHGLNEDQADAVARALVAATEAGTASPVSARANPRSAGARTFGSGKTHALAAFVCPRRSASRRRNRTPASSSPRTRTWRWIGSSPRSSREVSQGPCASGPSEGSITRFYRIRYTSPRRGVSVRAVRAEMNR